MGRKSSFAGVYMFYHIYNHKVYIGESGNVLRRLNEHRCSETSSVYKNGVSNFIPIILESEFADIRLRDPNYRSDREAYYIRKFKATDPDYGYNNMGKQWHMKKKDWIYEDRDPLADKSKRFKTINKLKKSNPILMYNVIDESVMMFLSKRSCGDFLGKDRAIISRATVRGRQHEIYIFYDIRPESRMEIAKKTLSKKKKAATNNNLPAKTMKQYKRGLKRVNEYCEYWGLPTIDLSELDID